jgi:hypothetical protein
MARRSSPFQELSAFLPILCDAKTVAINDVQSVFR